MKYRTIGRTGLQVSSLCLGTMTFATNSSPEAAKALFARSLEHGINFFDCANSYASGRAEEMLGACIAEHGCRDRIVLISKVCRPVSQDINGRGLSRGHILREVENSLRAGCAPTASISTSRTTTTRSRPSRKRCACWTTCSGRARSCIPRSAIGPPGVSRVRWASRSASRWRVSS